MNNAESRQKLNSLKVDELRQRAKRAGHTGLSRLRKAELIDLLLADAKAAGAAEEELPQPAASPQKKAGFISGLLRSVGLLGGVISLLLTLALPVLAVWAGARLANSLTKASDGLEDIETGLSLAAGNLKDGAIALGSASQALTTANQNLRGLDPLLGSVGDLLGDELPVTLETTREALVSAQDGAAAMDRVMRGLRFFGLDYEPDLPLDQSLEQMASSLEGLPESLRQTESDLSQSQLDLTLMAGDLATLAEDLDDVATDLEKTVDEIDQASGSVGELAQTVDSWADRMPRLRWIMAAICGLMGLWLLTLHINLWMVGTLVAERAMTGS